jgi:hypothetical protein
MFKIGSLDAGDLDAATVIGEVAVAIVLARSLLRVTEDKVVLFSESATIQAPYDQGRGKAERIMKSSSRLHV